MSSYCDVQSAISEIKDSLRGKKLALFLDFDGTLAEIQTIPDNTYMTKDMTHILTKISNLDEILTVAISGRQIDDLQKRIGLEELVYSGNHGLELNMDGSAVTYCLNQERVELLRAAIKNIVHELREKRLGKECGGNIEEKDTALTWHFFNVPENKAESIVKQACKIVEKYGFPISDGAGCIEVHDPTITKGNAIKKILLEKIGLNWHETHSVIFIGDSSSDEKGYATLCADPDFKDDCVTFIRILDNLRTPTKGDYIFSGTEDVYSLLSNLYDFYSQ